MIFISAQPDENYFLWQLEVQIKNFLDVGILPKHIHILLAFDKNKGPNPRALYFYSVYHKHAIINFYPDTRKSNLYVSSIRPNILKQHYIKYKYLTEKTIFYHDSDILLTGPANRFKVLEEDDYWYFSDTKSYMSYDYLIKRDPIVFKRMCEIVNITPEIIKKNRNNVGGAQAILKKITPEFWNVIENQCEMLYQSLFERGNIPINNQIPAFNSDMWVLLWNSYKSEKVKTHSILDFCWPHDSISEWDKKYIFHNAGVKPSESLTVFFKNSFKNTYPLEYDWSFINSSKCTFNYVKYFSELAKINQPFSIRDACFVLSARNCSSEEHKLTLTLKFLLKHFKIKIFIVRNRTETKNNTPVNNPLIEYIESSVDNVKLKRIIRRRGYRIIVDYNFRYIIPSSQLINAILLVRSEMNKVIIPYKATPIKITQALYKHFKSTLDIRILNSYKKRGILHHRDPYVCMVTSTNMYFQTSLGTPKFDFKIDKERLYFLLKALLDNKSSERVEGYCFEL